MTINERVYDIYRELEYRGVVDSQTEFGEELGLSRSYISRLLNGKENVSKKLIKNLETSFKINPKYLTDGEGEPFIEKQGVLGDMIDIPESRKASGAGISARKAFYGRRQKGILFVPVTAQAGYGKMIGDDIEYKLSDLERTIIPDFPYDGDDFRAFQVEGDSMEYVNEAGKIDGIPSGMWVLGQRVPQEDWRENLSLYRIHVVTFPRQVVVKRLLQDNPDQIILDSDNEMFPQERRNLSEVKEIWYVVRKLDWNMPPPRRKEITV